MKEFKKRKINKQSGAAMLISVIFFLFISLAIISGLVSPSVREFRDANVGLNSKKSFYLSESGAEDAYYRMLKSKTIGSSETITLDSNKVVTTITPQGNDKIQITSLGDVSSYQRKTEIILSTNTVIPFNYAVEAGQGGVNLASNTLVTGDIYSNGSITGDRPAKVTGNVISASSPDINGATGLIQGNSLSQYNQFRIGTVSGTAQAHTVNYVDSTGNIYCNTGTGNNRSCTDQSDPTYITFPISDLNITGWKAGALTGGIINNNYSISQSITIGPKKINGNLTISGGIVTISGTLWVTGNITVSGGATIQLASNYGSNDGIIIADGNISMLGGGHATGSGVAGSYIMLLSNSSSNSAFSISGGSGSVIIYAPFGTVNISGNASLKQVTANKILVSGANVTYESSLANTSFSGSSAGSWSIDSWGEK